MFIALGAASLIAENTGNPSDGRDFASHPVREFTETPILGGSGCLPLPEMSFPALGPCPRFSIRPWASSCPLRTLYPHRQSSLCLMLWGLYKILLEQQKSAFVIGHSRIIFKEQYPIFFLIFATEP